MMRGKCAQIPHSLPPVPWADLAGRTPYGDRPVPDATDRASSAWLGIGRRHHPYRPTPFAVLCSDGPVSMPAVPSTAAAAVSPLQHTDEAFHVRRSGGRLGGWRREPYAEPRDRMRLVSRGPFTAHARASLTTGALPLSGGYVYSHGPVHPPFPDPAASHGMAAAMVAAQSPMIEIAVGNLPYGICAREVQRMIQCATAGGVSVHAVRFWLHRGNRHSGLAFVQVRATDRAAVIGLHERILVGADVLYIYDSTQDAQRHLDNRDRLHPTSPAPKRVSFVCEPRE